MSHTGQYLAICHSDNSVVKIFSIPNGHSRPLSEYPDAVWTPPGDSIDLIFAPDERKLLILHKQLLDGEPDQRRCAILSLPNFERVETIPIPIAFGTIFSPDSKHILFYNNQNLILWSLAEQKAAWRIPERTVMQTIFSPDGVLIATALSDRRVIVRNSDNGSIRLELTHHRELLQCMTFTPDSRTLVTVTLNGRLKMSHIPTGQELFEIELKSDIHRTDVPEGAKYANLDFSTDGRRLFCHLQDNEGPRDASDEILIFDASDPTGEIN